MTSTSTTFSYQGKVVIVTGGNNGIGLATVNEFLKSGAKVAVFDVRPSTDAIQSEQRLEIVCDVGDETAAEAAVNEVVEKWGTIDILCNVAGVMDAMARVSETESAVWDRCLRVNVTGPFYLIRACTKHFLSKPRTEPTAQRGSIVNVCSTASKSGAHAGTAYTTSKHALLGLSRSTAWMYAKEGIRCNAILPGAVQTNIAVNSGYAEQIGTQPGFAAVRSVLDTMPAQAEAVDVARAILFTAGLESMTGAEIPVDRGWTTI